MTGKSTSQRPSVLPPWSPRRLSTALLITLVLAAGCEDVPNAVSSLPTPTPGSGAPSPAASGAPGASADPGASGTVPVPSTVPSAASPTPGTDVPEQPDATPTPAPTPTVSPTPKPSPSPLPTPVPRVKVSFAEPTREADFTASAMDIKVRFEPMDASPVKVNRIVVTYDGVELFAKDSPTGTELVIEDWSPHMVNSIEEADKTPVRAGDHALRVTAVTSQGATSTAELPFRKPLLLRGWVTTTEVTPARPTARALPAINPPRAHHGFAALGGQLFSWFGENATSEFDGLSRLPLDAVEFGWNAIPAVGAPSTSVPYRRRPGLAALNERLYVVGGQSRTDPATLVPANDMRIYNVSTDKVENGVNLPVTVVDPAVAVLDRYLYVAGGFTDVDFSQTVPTLYRLEIDPRTGAKVGLAWEKRADMPEGVGRSGARLVGLDGQLFLVGGITTTGLKPTPILRYDPFSDTWTREPVGLPRGVTHPAAVAMDGLVWVFGGDASVGASKLVLRNTVAFDPVARTVRTYASDEAPSLPAARAGLGAALHGPRNQQQLYLVGGHSYDGTGAEVYTGEVLRADML
ncbi:MAG: hypothetical protein VKS61_18430 [Candidatus Sericytochromatia bacterium]|nr:hypothetical protein [Candidatus Sericytochromatia bacterium]